MNVLIIESIGRPVDLDFSKTSVAHVRNAVVIAEILGADIITCDRDMGVTIGKCYDHIICSYASPYMKYKTLIQVVRDNPQAKLWWLVNDHDLEDNVLFRNVIKETNGGRKINMICNNSRSNYRGWILRKKMKNAAGEFIGYLNDFIDSWFTINLNVLIMSYIADYKWSDKTDGVIYYGTMRKWRLNYLLDYQNANITYSVTKKSQQKFINNGVTNCEFVDKLSWQVGHEDLLKYKASLYIEDLHTHTHYAHMANRFYESLMTNVITFFDVNCRDNIIKSGYQIDPFFIVSSPAELDDKVSMLNDKDFFERCLGHNHTHLVLARRERNAVVDKLTKIFNLPLPEVSKL